MNGVWGGVLARGYYLTPMTFGVAVVHMVYFSFPERAPLRNDDHVWNQLSVTATLLLAFVALISLSVFVAWTKSPRRASWSDPGSVVILFVLSAWSLAAMLSLGRGEIVSALVFAMPVIWALLLSRPPVREDVTLATLTWVSTIAIMTWGYWTLELLGIVDGFDVRYENRLTWPNLDFFPDYRWRGPFASFGAAAAAGATLVIVGIQKISVLNLWLSATGLAILFLANSRIEAVGLALAITVWIYKYRSRVPLVSKVPDLLMRLGLVAAFGGVASAFWMSGGNGRVEIWRGYFEVLGANPLFGVGHRVVSSLPETQNAGHAHNFLLDIAALYGLFCALLLLTAITVFWFSVARNPPQPPTLFYPLATLAAVIMTMNLGHNLLYFNHEGLLIVLLVATSLAKPSNSLHPAAKGELGKPGDSAEI